MSLAALALVLLAGAGDAQGDAQGGVEGEGRGEGEAPGVSLRSALKGTALVTHEPELPAAARDGAVALWRLRLEPRVKANDTVSVELAWDLNLQLQSVAVVTLPFVAVSAPPSAWRLEPLESTWGQGNFAGSQQLDRLAVELALPRTRVTVGRQAIGFGRGVLFSAVDVFSPFTPLQLDREWRRGVDAVRVDVRLHDRVSVDGALVLSSRWEESAAVGRVRGYFGPGDVEVLGGWRAGDAFAGLASSIAVLGAAVHGELAAFRPEGDGPWVWKAVAGVSYDFDVGQGLHALAEYHYNGFGLRLPADLTALAGSEFQQRFLRGDMQILGRHALALVASYPVTADAGLSATVMIDPSDGSGLVAPGLSWDFADRASLAAGLYAAWGRGFDGARLLSQFGATPLSVFAQLRLYDQR